MSSTNPRACLRLSIGCVQTSGYGHRRVVPTGSEYLDSLRDGRAVYIHGEKVPDVTAHPAFRSAATSVAGLYDDFHRAPAGSALRVPTDTGSGGHTHPFFTTARSAADLVTAQGAIAAWQRPVFGWMGRTPDYKASFFGTLDSNAEFYGAYAENARGWYRRVQESMTYFSHAVVDPPIDRHRPADANKDVCVHVRRETDSGIVVSGAKVVATGAAVSQATMVGHIGMPLRDNRFGLVFVVPMATHGIKLLCRTSYEYAATVAGAPFDYPLSSRFDENDAILVFDDVEVPWENVLVYDADTANRFGAESGFAERFTFHGCTRLAVKMDFLAGCLLKATEAVGSSRSRSVEVQIGEVLNFRDLFWGLSDSMASGATPWVQGSVLPSRRYGFTYRTFMGSAYARVREIIQQVLGSSLIYLNSSVADWRNEEMRPYLDRYLRGSGDIAAVDRVKILKLVWDAIGTEFAGRHELYERNYGGDHDNVRLQTLRAYREDGSDRALTAYVDRCLDGYDLDGWTGRT